MKLTLDVFEGPLDLLLHLIKQDGLEISRVSIARVAEQYLNYVETMKDLDIDMASDFLLMAAELAHIKSKALLPVDDKESGEDDGDASADKLVAKLRLYQKYKTLAQKLAARAWLGRDVFKRATLDFGGEEFEAPVSTDDAAAQDGDWEVGAYDLVKAFNAMLARLPKKRRDHHVAVERVSVTERIYEVLDHLRRAESVLFTDLFAGHVEKIEFVVTFLAILEMGKLRMVRIYQTENYAPIRLQCVLAEASEVEPNKVVSDFDSETPGAGN